MTVTATSDRQTHTGDGVTTTPFGFSFKVFQTTDIEVYIDGVLKTITTHYSVALTDSGNSGGVVTFVTAPANGAVILIRRKLTLTQGTVLPIEGPFPAKSVEKMSDRVTMLVQQVNTELERALRLATTYTGSFTMTLPTTLTARRAIMINTAGTGLELSTYDPDTLQAAAAASASAAAASAAAAATSATNAATSATNAATSATNASTSATLAQDWATKTNGYVTGTDNSSKSWAIGGTGNGQPTSGPAKDWATKTSGNVDGSEFSAKEYAQGTQVATGGSAKNWAQQTGADVTGAAANSRSAKSWAQDALTGATLGGSAKDWAQTAEDTLVNGTEYSAKHYAAKAAASAAFLNTKGQILTHDGTQNQRLNVGANGKVLMADSAQTNGIKWDHPVPVGSEFAYGGSSVPSRYLLAYGQAISRTTYSELFAIYGTTFGSGDGSTTFNMPDNRGRTNIGKDNMGGSAASRITSASTNGANSTTLGGVGGAQTHTLSIAELASHDHGVGGRFSNNSGTTSTAGQSTVGYVNNTSGNTTSLSTGSDNAHSNTQPWIAKNILVYAGV